MKLQDIMTDTVIRINPEETAAVAARALAHYNIGALPVCGRDGTIRGVVTDRDLVTRCMAAGKSPNEMLVGEIMTGNVICAGPDMDTTAAAHLMGRQQIRRLPVVKNGKLCGMVSLGDLAGHEDCSIDAADALGDICQNISRR